MTFLVMVYFAKFNQKDVRWLIFSQKQVLKLSSLRGFGQEPVKPWGCPLRPSALLRNKKACPGITAVVSRHIGFFGQPAPILRAQSGR